MHTQISGPRYNKFYSFLEDVFTSRTRLCTPDSMAKHGSYGIGLDLNCSKLSSFLCVLVGRMTRKIRWKCSAGTAVVDMEANSEGLHQLQKRMENIANILESTDLTRSIYNYFQGVRQSEEKGRSSKL